MTFRWSLNECVVPCGIFRTTIVLVHAAVAGRKRYAEITDWPQARASAHNLGNRVALDRRLRW